MPNKFEGAPQPQESKEDSPDELVTISVAEIVQNIKDDPEKQKNMFGKTLTEEEFEKYFPGGGITAETLSLATSAFGLTTLRVEDVQKMLDKHDKK